jgi:hypothetical protein
MSQLFAQCRHTSMKLNQHEILISLCRNRTALEEDESNKPRSQVDKTAKKISTKEMY